MIRPWYTVWYDPEDHETVAYMTQDRMAEIGGAAPGTIVGKLDLIHWVNQGVAILTRWCRVNCESPGRPVNVRGRTGWAFKESSDAIKFKLTWG